MLLLIRDSQYLVLRNMKHDSKGCLLIFKNGDGRIGPIADDEDVEELFSQCDPDIRKYNDNPYFTNRSLTKRITFCKYGTTNLSVVKIDWKDGMVALLNSETTCEKRSVSCISESYAEIVMCDLGLSSQLKLACNSASFFDLENTNSELKSEFEGPLP
ncbi:hypothetical protein MKW98_031112 [Papaver atlanticum]|uniref:Uncharacterized protein n=1 Tax=Papaver atlanticum TaxID=357466 RepID=A0AAD4XLB4_9MAGN|nr:hypothetical protein MKW98_031112 [Papaver atlanticum]